MMDLRIVLPTLVSSMLVFASLQLNAASCDADGAVQFLCGPVSPEDLAIIPDSPWIVAAGMEDDGYLYMLNSDDLTSTSVYPSATSQTRFDSAAYGDCPGHIQTGFRPHGLNLRAGENGNHILYVVRHGARESIEVFDVDTRTRVPSLTWIGCVVAPDSVVFNSVAALPEGGIIGTNFRQPEGELWEWHEGGEWSKVPGSETAGPNGIEVSADGRWIYIAGWASKSFIRLSRGQTPIQKDSVDVGHHIDNLRWAPDGSLFAAGHNGSDATSIFRCLSQQQCQGVSSRVTRVDPDNLTAQQIVNYPSNELLILGTVAIQVGDEIWVGGIAGGDRIARFPVTNP